MLWILYDFVEIMLDLKAYLTQQEKTLVSNVYRIQYIIHRGRDRTIGLYEKHVLNRELNQFKQNGGDEGYFI